VSRRHGPAPSIWPVTLALGVSIAAAGVVTHWLVVVSGLLLTVLAIAAWTAELIGGEA
jgi:hypothetical protein